MNKSQAKVILFTMVGVALAGVVMAQFPTAPIIGQARRGFNGG